MARAMAYGGLQIRASHLSPWRVRVLHLEPVRRAVLAVRQLARSRLHQYTQAEAAASCSPVVADLCLKLTCESPQPHMKFRTD
jgi:hypothetical protein